MIRYQLRTGLYATHLNLAIKRSALCNPFGTSINHGDSVYEHTRTPELNKLVKAGQDGSAIRHESVPPPNLPVSPLMDPSFTSARGKYSNRKSKPNKEQKTAFQRTLEKNPYARALATPIRACTLTKEPLPRFFLQAYGLLEHPENGIPFWVPQDVEAEQSRAASTMVEATTADSPATSQSMEIDQSGGNPELQGQVLDRYTRGKQMQGITEMVVVQGGENVVTPQEGLKKLPDTQLPNVEATSRPINTSQSSPSPANTARYTYAYTLARKELLNVVQKRKSGYGEDFHHKMGSPRIIQNSATRRVLARSHWRKDMEDFVLELSRRRAVEDLLHCRSKKRGYVVGLDSWDRARLFQQAGAYLWLGDGRADSIDTPESIGSPEQSGNISVMNSKGKKIPVYDLGRLFGARKLEDLRVTEPDGIWSSPIVAIKHRNMTVDLQMKLWKLQVYLMEAGEAPVV